MKTKFTSKGFSVKIKEHGDKSFCDLKPDNFALFNSRNFWIEMTETKNKQLIIELQSPKLIERSVTKCLMTIRAYDFAIHASQSIRYFL